MTLLSQWCDEIERSSNAEMNVVMYYGTNRSNLQEEIDAGVDVVVTRFVFSFSETCWVSVTFIIL